MKNLKNTLVAIGLAAVLGVGAATANAAVVISDSSIKETKGQCSVKDNGVFGQFAGVISGLTGISIEDLFLSDAPCKTDEEILMDGYRKC